jgi:hypothetical protein
MNSRYAALAFANIMPMLIVCGVPRTAAAQQIYKCVNAQGDIAYQDHACSVGLKQSVVPAVSAPAASITTVTSAQFGTTPAASSTPPATPPASEPVKPSPPPLWFCTNPEDGSHYVSQDGHSTSRWVPAGILGATDKGLAQNSGPNDGAGNSAPASAKPKPLAKSPGNVAAADYVEVHDDCVAADAEQTCEYLRDELDSVERKLRRAFKDERAMLEPRQAELRDQLDGC